MAAWIERNGVIEVPRIVTKFDRVRLTIGYSATAAAAAYAIVAVLKPDWAGFASQPLKGWLIGPALLVAAVVHLVLVVSGVRRPLARFTRQSVMFSNLVIPREQVTQVWVQRMPPDMKSVLMVGTTRPGLSPAVAAVTDENMNEAELNALCELVRKRLGYE